MAEQQGDLNKEISDSDRKLDALCDMIRDACAKMDEGGKRLDARMDAVEENFRKMDSERKDAEEKKEEEAKADAAKKDEGEEEKKEAKADRKDAEEEEKGEPKEVAADKRKDSRKDASKKDEEEEKKEEAHADSQPMTRAEAATLRADIAALQARAPAIISDSDRERFAAIQERADPVFQAFNDRAPPPMDGETPTQYQRRLGSKLQGHSPKWAEARLSSVSDEAMLGTILTDIYADSMAAARKGVDIPVGKLRENRQTTAAGHTIVTFDGETDAWTRNFTGRVTRSGSARA